MKQAEQVHPKDGVGISQQKSIICSNELMSIHGYTFASCIPTRTTQFSDALIERQRLEAHDYCASPDVRHLRKFGNVHLIDFRKLPLIMSLPLTLLAVQNLRNTYQSLLSLCPGITQVNSTQEKSFLTY